MEIEASNIFDKLNTAVSLLERTVAFLEQREALMSGDVQKIVAAVEQSAEVSQRELELERKLAAAEQQIVELRAQGSKAASPARKTLPAATTQLLAKGGITSLESVEAGAVDAALAGLSLEQRIAVKAQLIRAGALA
jgi:hypothetical protein